MTITLTAWLCNSQGERLHYFGSDFLSVSYTKVVSGISKLHSFTALVGDMSMDLIQVDSQLQIWLKPEGGVAELDCLIFLRHWEWILDESGSVQLSIGGNSTQDEFLDRRVVAYRSTTAQATATAEAADNLMKRIIRENFTAPVDTSRVLPNVAGSIVTVEPDSTSGPLLDKSFSFQAVLELLQEIGEETYQAGNEVFFEMAIANTNSNSGWVEFQFRTYIGQPGTDRTQFTEHPVIFGPAFGNIEEMRLSYDYREEENAIFVLGQGVGLRRTVVEVHDTDAQIDSVWNRREGMVDARDVDDLTILTARGDTRIGETKPHTVVAGRVRSTEHTVYLRDWRLGDRVTVDALDVQFEAIVRVVNVQYQRGFVSIAGEIEEVL